MNLGDRLNKLTQRLNGDQVRRDLKSYTSRLEAVNAMAPQLVKASDLQLQQRAGVLRKRARDGVPLEQLLVAVFALVREVAHRTIGLRPFDVQVIGGFGLHEGRIVQMQTGEGKTLAAVSPVVLRALGGSGVHVLTFNDYLARRDAEWMGPIYRALGLTVGFIQQGLGPEERRAAYQADVTYLTAKEAGFDFLRDGLVYEVAELVQRPFHAALVDEADSILIDEARVPLVIAGATDRRQGRQGLMRGIVTQFEPGVHFVVDAHGLRRDVYLTEEGANRAEALLGGKDLYAPANLQSLTELNLALHAEVLMRRDIDYIVRHDRVEIVDDFTGRVVQDRHWPDGLQAAIEAKEGVRPTEEGRVLGSITLQHFLRQYPHLCGMTATAESAADELFGFYGLELLAVPPNRACIRSDHPDVVLTHREAKRSALLSEIAKVHRTGRPILVGTLTVEESEGLASDLRAAGIACNVLNAKRDNEEASIVADAGSRGAVTISTNMAGRGTDIRLGGSDGEGSGQVVALGGLYVIGTNRHESRRIDDQLRGRGGRQGDPGSTRFFISLEDDLLVQYGVDDLIPERWRPTVQMEALENPVLGRKVAHAQRVIEGQNYDTRHHLWRYSNLIEGQRRVIAGKRRAVLEGTAAGVLHESQPEGFNKAFLVLGEQALIDLERRLTLNAIDECWADHLAMVEEIREGVHLAEVGGLSPLEEFHKGAAASFVRIRDAIDAHVTESFAALEFTADGLDLEKMGLRGPSSTWTYLVNDDPFSDRMAAALMSRRNIGFAANAAFAWPLFLLWALSRRFRRRGRHLEESR